MKKQEKDEREEGERKVIEDQVKLNEKVQLRIELERLEEGRVASEVSENKNDGTHVEDHAPAVETQVTEEEEEIRNNDLTEVTFADYV